MSDNNLIIKKDSAALALQKTGSLLSITDKILATKTQTKHVVKQQQRIGKFIVQEGIATDSETGLTWLRFAHGQTWQNNTAVGNTEAVNWETAFEVAKQFNQRGGYGGFTDWRLPTLDELKTLIDKDKGREGNYIDADVFPNNVTSYYWYWSASPVANSSYDAWIVYFDGGSDDWDGKYDGYFVRLVRAGQ
jgi:hypothetical protein